jgi:mono/diheme cytochrome c family protein
MNLIYKTGATIFLFLCTSFLAVSQDFPPWDAPESASKVQNPVESNKESLEAGKAFYNAACKACHGEKGRGDGLIKGANLTTEKFLLQTDGAIFWKMQTGRGQMLSFKASPPEQIWSVINYVRNLSAKKEIIAKRNAIVQLAINKQSDSKEVTAKILEVTNDKQQVPLENIKVSFFAKRYFGNMAVALDAPHSTDANGETTITFPDGIIGDENGALTIVANIDDMDFNPAEASDQVNWGEVNPKNYWTERRALWKSNDYVPVWLLLTFAGGAITVWSFIIYVMFQIMKIKLIGDKLKK